MALQETFDRHDAEFDAWRMKRPDGLYADFITERVMNGLRKNRPHTTLGPLLKDCEDWWSHGQGMFDELMSVAPVGQNARIIDYGCGSLRVGGHYIRRQARGAYMGMDLTEDYMAYGRDLVGEALMTDKAPRLGLIADLAPTADAFGADLVISVLAAPQVHPDEVDTYYGDLKRCAAAHGARVVLTANTSDRVVRYAASGRAWPLEQFEAWMSPLRLVEARHRHDAEKETGLVRSHHLVFQR